MSDQKQILKAFIIDNFLFGEGDDIHDEMSFLDEGIIDSTGILELVAFIEEEFSIRIEDDELIPENLDSVNNVIAFIARKFTEQGKVITD